MIKLKHGISIFLSGALWFGVGCFLLTLGLKLLTVSSQIAYTERTPLLDLFKSTFGGKEEAAAALIFISLFVGFLKGRFVLRRSADRVIARIRSLPNPLPLSSLYSPQYLALIGLMVLLGMSIRFLGVSDEVRGVVDVTIGSALINGSMHYFRELFKKVNEKASV